MADDKSEVLSLRVSADLSGALKIVADRHGITVSDLLRLAAEDVIRVSPDALRERLACPSCKGSGQRFKTRGLDHG